MKHTKFVLKTIATDNSRLDSMVNILLYLRAFIFEFEINT